MGNILRFALQMELDGKNFYHRLALHVKASDHKKVLFSLAADEEKYYQKLKTVQSTDKHRF